jgi:hypothetical protein
MSAPGVWVVRGGNWNELAGQVKLKETVCRALSPLLCKVVESGLRQDRLDSRILNQDLLVATGLCGCPPSARWPI